MSQAISERESDIRRLIDLAIESLARMQLDDGTFCFELVRGEQRPRGRSLRYTAMVYIGLCKAQATGHRHGFDLERVRGAFHDAVGSPELRAGDLGLALWVDAVSGERSSEDVLRRLQTAVESAGGLAHLEGQEVGWILQGLALQSQYGLTREAERLARTSVDLLVLRNQARNGLFYHLGAPSLRRRFPNFATQIYSVLALATVARHGLDARALGSAGKAADRLAALQLRDGGWPWLFDARRGGVVERYEIYSVHQHAMAPMGLLALGEAGGRDSVDAVRRGLAWIGGPNELGQDMVDEQAGMIYRSVRRRRPWSRVGVAANTALSSIGLRTDLGEGRTVELNATCRPYELGWLLEGWCGREPLAASEAS